MASGVAGFQIPGWFAPPVALAVALGSSAVFGQSATSPSVKAPRFDVAEIRVVGNTTLPAIDIERVIYPYVGPQKTIDDLNAARTSLENAYHAKGFGTVFVDLPEQQVEDGLVRLKVTEGKLSSVRMTGARFFSDRQLLAQLPDAQVGVVPNLPKLQQEIATVNAESAERAVVPILKAGSQPGTVNLGLNVQDHLPLHTTVEFNNQQTEGTAPLRGLVSFSMDNLFNRLDQFAFQYETTPQQLDQVGVVAANASVHLYDGGPALSMYYIDSKTNVVSAGALGVLGKGSIYGARLPVNFANTADFSGTLTYGLDYKHFLQSITVNPQTGLNTPISYLEMSLDYSAAWRPEKWQSSLDIGAFFGSRQLVDDTDHFATARYEGRANFFLVRASSSTTYQLPAGFHATVRLAAQGAVEPLVSNEYFSIAGSDGVRGYLESEEFGDDAIRGTLQFSTPQAHPLSHDLAVDLFAFIDDGRVTFLDPLPGQPTNAVLRSAGGGIDLLFGRNFTGELTWAYPLLNGPATAAGDARLLFVVRGTL